MAKEVQEDQRETFGLLLENKVFLLSAFTTAFFFVTFCILSFGNFWEIFYQLSHWATLGLIVGNTLGSFGSIINLASWVLIDLNSWLDSAIPMLVVAICFIICGMHFLIQIFHGISFVDDNHKDPTETKTGFRLKSPLRVPLQEEEAQDDEYADDDDIITKKDALWISLLTAVNFFQGILAFLVLVFKCITLDGNSTTLGN